MIVSGLAPRERLVMMLLRVLIILILFSSSHLYAACPDSDYEETTCLYGETGTCRIACDASQAKIQAAIDVSATGAEANGYENPTLFRGDGVYVPAGSATWTTGLTWLNKNINLIGAGYGDDGTVITANGTYFINMRLNYPTYAKSRISGFKISGTCNSAAFIYVQLQYGTDRGYGWRFDNLNITLTGGTYSNVFDIVGFTYGLIDNCTITADRKTIRMNAAIGSKDGTYPGSYERSMATGLGTADAVYIEDSTLTNTANTAGAVISELDMGGGSLVLRHNTIYGEVFAKYTRGSGAYGPRKIEVYNNTINGARPGLPEITTFARSSGGTGVFYNNTVTGFTNSYIYLDDYRAIGLLCDGYTIGCCDGTQSEDGNAECVDATGLLFESANEDGSCPTEGYINTGWPCMGQPGRGTGSPGSEAAEPWYEWNNGPEAACAAGVGTCTDTVDFHSGAAKYVRSSVSPHSNGAYEYVDDTQHPTYAAYTYPHPLRDADPPAGFIVTTTNTGSGHAPSHDGARTVQTGGTLTFTSGVYNGWKVAISGTCGCTTDGCTVTPTENCTITCTSSEIQLMPW